MNHIAYLRNICHNLYPRQIENSNKKEYNETCSILKGITLLIVPSNIQYRI